MLSRTFQIVTSTLPERPTGLRCPLLAHAHSAVPSVNPTTSVKVPSWIPAYIQSPTLCLIPDLFFSLLPFFFLFCFGLHHLACGILVPWPGTEPRPLAVRTWSPNHWTAREFPILPLLLIYFLWFHQILFERRDPRLDSLTLAPYCKVSAPFFSW